MENGPVHCLFTRQNYWAANLPVNRGRLTSTLSATITTLMTMSLSRRLKRAHLIYGWKTTLKTGQRAISVKISIIITSLKKSRKTSRRRTHAGWPLIFSAVFKDRRVREAVTTAFDFEWMNKALFYNARAEPTVTSRIPSTPPEITLTPMSWYYSRR